MNITDHQMSLVEEATYYYNELEAGVDEDTLTISPEADVLLGKALELGLCGHFDCEDMLNILGWG